MKNRIYKKHSWCHCCHDHSYSDLLTSDPYDIYENIFVCAVRHDIRDDPEKFRSAPANVCYRCKHAAFSYEEIRAGRERKKSDKEALKYMDKHPEEFIQLPTEHFDLFSNIDCPF